MKDTVKERIRPLGIHTAVGHLQKFRRWKEIPYLRENGGMLPPFMITVGSRVRVHMAKETLKLREAVLVDEMAKKKFGLGSYGRVAIMLGIFESGGVELPLAVAESQMGCPATQINLREMMYYASTGGYMLGRKKICSGGISVIRAGTCAGVNGAGGSDFSLSIGDIAIASETYGCEGAVAQSYLGRMSFVQEGIADIFQQDARTLNSFGLRLSNDGKYMVMRSSPNLVLHLQGAANSLGLRSFVGGNFTKNSLYAEMDEKAFSSLRYKYGIISTEMEQLMVEMLTGHCRIKGITASSALVSAVIGAIPGKSFPETKEERKAAEDAENGAVLAAAQALANLAAGYTVLKVPKAPSRRPPSP